MGLKIFLEDVVGIGDRPKTKGNRFEQYVLDHIFRDEKYELIEKFSKYDSSVMESFFKEHNKKALNPDFYFRNRETKEFFFVECKYRHSTFTNKYGKVVCEICKPYQLKRYKDIQEAYKKQVYICLGFGGESHEPSSVHLIPVSEAYPQLFPYKLTATKIEQNGIPV